ncbi:phosphoribosylaminoimidazolecarboxamide formyltransferase / IMP cyclohydrolase [Arboricoccus pini]|uniref:Bifunctional purine biosynthesis protein PurH n=1 Tax=Arboricoccus pini TaxID=1963835 RepID=A0A212QYX6_9PROT|nr:phosphoribosylaminoimidazolecarboxamide formyltransferase / IMP cyclohydrolase [Arboricoccus pini]
MAFAQALHARGVELVSTGGTAKTLAGAGLPVREVAALTGFPEMMDGRVKTLHPMIHGGLLARRDDADHQAAMEAHAIAPIDLLVVNLYPFEATVARGADFEETIENIDIGGPAMLRSAAKNHEGVAVIVDPDDYALVLAEITEGGTTAETRRLLAAKCFARTAAYDAAIASWFARELKQPFPARMTIAGTRRQALRYGENPHQAAAFYVTEPGRPGLPTATQLQGKDLSYNNLADTDAAFELVCDFDEPAVAIIKHANPCGVAIAEDPAMAWKKALASDPVSAFGGIVAINREISAALAQELTALFLEVVIAPSVAAAALPILATKKNLRVLTTGGLLPKDRNTLTYRSLGGGFLAQEGDFGEVAETDRKCVTQRPPSTDEMRDLAFAWKVVKHVKSNAIVLARDGATVGIGMGQTNRVDSVWIAAKRMAEGPGAGPCVVASDAFFPFADGLNAAVAAGATAAIQPGGSVRDSEVIEAANEKGVAMLFTGMRHFRH